MTSIHKFPAFSLLSSIILTLTACAGPQVERSEYVLTNPTTSDYEEEQEDNTSGLIGEDENDMETDEDINDVETFELASEVFTFVGSGENASVDGTKEHASFAVPKMIRIGHDGNIVVIDSGSGEVRFITPDGDVSTLALSDDFLVDPTGLAVDNDGTIYISDQQQHCIFKIQKMIAEVYAGTCGVSGNIDGEIEDALFNQPRGLALKDDGALYVADSANNRIRMIGPKGNVHTVAGIGESSEDPSTGPIEEAHIYLPFSLAIHESGDIYFSGFDHCIRRIHHNEVENVAGLCRTSSNTGQTDGPASQARFNTPTDIVFTDDGSLLIVDSFNDKIRKLSSDIGKVSTIAGTTRGFQDGHVDVAQFDTPRSITIDDEGNIYVADAINNRIRMIVVE